MESLVKFIQNNRLSIERGKLKIGAEGAFAIIAIVVIVYLLA